MAKAKNPEEITIDDEMKAEIEELETTENVEATADESDTTDAPSDPTTIESTAEDDDFTKAGKRSRKAIAEAAAEAARQAAKAEVKDEDDAPKAPKRSVPNPANQHGKKYRAALEQVDRSKQYTLDEALELAQKTSTSKFDGSIEMHVNLGVDPRQADQMVRSTVTLPAGTGKTIRIAVLTSEAKAADAKAAGADIVGEADLLSSIEKGKLDFDMLITTPDQMAKLGKVAKILGPRGLMPNPKSGSVTTDIKKAVTEAKGGKVEFRIDKSGIIHQAIGKVSFTAADLRQNADALLGAILKVKPGAAKGTYVKAISVASSMGPGVKVDAAATISAQSTKR